MPNIAISESVKSSARLEGLREILVLGAHREVRVRKRSELNKLEILRDLEQNTQTMPGAESPNGSLIVALAYYLLEVQRSG